MLRTGRDPDSTQKDGLFRIDWNQHAFDAQQALLMASALPQAPAYAAALVDAGHAQTEFGVLRFHDRPVGYVFVERRPFFRWVSSFRIYRGPVWLDNSLPGTVQREFFQTSFFYLIVFLYNIIL